MSLFIFTTVAVLLIVGGAFIDPATYYGVVRTAGIVIACFVVARFTPTAIRLLIQRAENGPWDRAEHLVIGISFTWIGNLMLALMVLPYRIFSDQDMPLELWHSTYRYLLPLAASITMVGGFFHLSARTRVGHPNWWLRTAIPLTILVGIAAIVYNVRLNV